VSEKQILKREIVQTEDGSHTLFVPELNENYHSIHGARQEAEHIFIKEALQFASQLKTHLNVLEIGFGTGLNAYLTLLFAQKHDIHIRYFGIEKYPIQEKEYSLLNYAENDGQFYSDFLQLHQAAWENEARIHDSFLLKKEQADFRKMQLPVDFFDVVYFDAFGPDVQADLWSEEVFRIIYQSMKSGGVLTTYSVKGVVRRAMKSVGFKVEKIPGPPGKREMSRAIKA